jgi:DNA-damage-inducible protein D
MIDKQSPVHGTQSFEELKQSNEHGAEYWSALDLQAMLGYSQWQRFNDAVKRAMTSCEASGNSAGDRFADAGKPITGGKGAVQVVDDYRQQKQQSCLPHESALRICQH